MYFAIYSLLYSISGGQNWGELAEPFRMISIMDGFVFTLMIFFIMFGFFNVVIGIFVTETGDIENLDRDLVLQNAARRSEAMTDNIKFLFEKIDKHRDGFMTCDELSVALKNKDI